MNALASARSSEAVVTPFRRFVRSFMASRLAVSGLVLVLALVLLALFAPFIAPQNPYDLQQLDFMDGKLAPGSQNMDGTLTPTGSAPMIRGGICSAASCMVYGPACWWA